MASYSSSTVSLFEARMLLRTYHFILLSFYSVYAQDLSIPTTWRVAWALCFFLLDVFWLFPLQKPTSNLPLENRLNLTHSLIDAFTPQYNNITGKIDGKSHSVIANETYSEHSAKPWHSSKMRTFSPLSLHLIDYPTIPIQQTSCPSPNGSGSCSISPETYGKNRESHIS